MKYFKYIVFLVLMCLVGMINAKAEYQLDNNGNYYVVDAVCTYVTEKINNWVIPYKFKINFKDAKVSNFEPVKEDEYYGLNVNKLSIAYSSFFANKNFGCPRVVFPCDMGMMQYDIRSELLYFDGEGMDTLGYQCGVAYNVVSESSVKYKEVSGSDSQPIVKEEDFTCAYIRQSLNSSALQAKAHEKISYKAFKDGSKLIIDGNNYEYSLPDGSLTLTKDANNDCAKDLYVNLITDSKNNLTGYKIVKSCVDTADAACVHYKRIDLSGMSGDGMQQDGTPNTTPDLVNPDDITSSGESGNGIVGGNEDKIDLEHFCQGPVMGVFTTLGWIIFIIKILIPILLIIFGSVDFAKAVLAGKDDAIKKSAKTLALRAVAGIIIFFIPTILNAVVGVFDDSNVFNGTFGDCTSCMLKPGNSSCKGLGE
ncbi:MAG: hypothetical protein E7163_02795 [Firmicutes bacterium]|nr:hypothetical protein [Bacillota bacterium]